MTRFEARENVMQMLFQMESQMDFSKEAAQTFIENFISDDSQLAYIKEVYEAYASHANEIDELIETNSTGWKLERIAKVAFETAMKRGKKVISIDKANVLESSRLWRKTMHELSAEYPEVEYSDMFVDNAAMQLVRNPGQFDVIVTSNMFGDILSDEASQITGSIGMLASASMGATTRGMYEPIHGSAPDIAGQNKANPIATILSAAMMLRYSFGLLSEAEMIETAVDKVLNAGWRTADLMGNAEGTPLSCTEITEKIIEAL